MNGMVYTEPFPRDLSLLDEDAEAAVWNKLELVEKHPGSARPWRSPFCRAGSGRTS